MFAVKVTHL